MIDPLETYRDRYPYGDPEYAAGRLRRILALDVGGQADFHAAVICEYKLSARPIIYVSAIKRWPLGYPQGKLLADLTKVMTSRHMNNGQLVMDGTGLGWPIAIDLWQALEKAKCAAAGGMIVIKITAGQDHTIAGPGVHHVSKVLLVAGLAAALAMDRFKIAKGLAETQTLVQELTKFRVRVTRAGAETYAAETERVHDDLVTDCCLGVFAAEHIGYPPPPIPAGPKRMIAMDPSAWEPVMGVHNGRD